MYGGSEFRPLGCKTCLTHVSDVSPVTCQLSHMPLSEKELFKPLYSHRPHRSADLLRDLPEEQEGVAEGQKLPKSHF